ncbi:MAG: hypothetical protein KTR32_01595 [Granulosicoccus sp.]|nr:hypothetical protein [Granulosicoccus sp.]
MCSIFRIRPLQLSALLLVLSALLTACGGDGDSSDPNRFTPPQPRNTLPDLNTSDATFNGDHHAGSETCDACHNYDEMVVETESGASRDVSIGTAWETSTMANSTRDPYWHAVFAAELYDFPNLEETINDKCMVCHAPMAHDLAAKTGMDLRLFDKGSVEQGDYQQGLYTMDDTNELFNHGMDGVSCTLCHQMDGTNFGTQESMTGGYVINGSPTADKADRPAYGQYSDPIVGYMRNNVEFLAQHGPHISMSESCATCHNLNIEPVDPQGNPIEGAPLFAEQAIFSEWLVSDYAVGGSKEASCQACHMPVQDQDVFIGQGADMKRPDFAEHTFLGANTVMQDMFSNYAEELGIDPELDFQSSIVRNREFLKGSASITLSQGTIDAPEVSEMETLSFDVTIENLTGHKLPAGYHSRRVYLHVQVLDQNNQLIFESGRLNADGSIVGLAEDLDPFVWEPHYDVITSEDQVQVYQAVVGNSEGSRTHSLLAGSFYLKDNRLTPSGYDKVAATEDTRFPPSFGTFGAAMDDDDFNNGSDVVTYQVEVPANGIYTVVVALRYQPLNFGHLQELFTRGDALDVVDNFRTMFNATQLRDEFIDTATQIMQ